MNEVSRGSAVVPPIDSLQGAVDTGVAADGRRCESGRGQEQNGTFKVVGGLGVLSQRRSELVYYRTDAGVWLVWEVGTNLGENWMVSRECWAGW